MWRTLKLYKGERLRNVIGFLFEKKIVYFELNMLNEKNNLRYLWGLPGPI